MYHTVDMTYWYMLRTKVIHESHLADSGYILVETDDGDKEPDEEAIGESMHEDDQLHRIGKS